MTGIKNNWKETLGQIGRFEEMGLCTFETKKSLDYNGNVTNEFFFIECLTKNYRYSTGHNFLG